MNKEKGFGYCGLACSLCDDKNCKGCKMDDSINKDWCKSKSCCKEKNISGCWLCGEYPCGDNIIFAKPKPMAFNQLMREYGPDFLEGVLEENETAGMKYHYEGKTEGDYDKGLNEEAVIDIILKGKTV